MPSSSPCFTGANQQKATVAQFAAPQGTARFRLEPRGPRLRRASQEPTKVAAVAQFAAAQGAAMY
eukprot:1708138-Pyramimonas_sp.AAC.1